MHSVLTLLFCQNQVVMKHRLILCFISVVTFSANLQFQSQDYDQCENALFLKEQEQLKSRVSISFLQILEDIAAYIKQDWS